MKNKLALVASALGLFAVAPVWAGTINFDLSNCGSIVSSVSQCPGDLGTATATYTDSTDTYSLTAEGIDYRLNPLNLYVKNGGAGENGLGLADTLQNEVNHSNTGQGIVLDMSQLLDAGFGTGTVTLGSLQSGESGDVCNFSEGGLVNCQQVYGAGSTEVGTAQVSWGATDPYLLFWQPSACAGNFLVDSLTASNVPEPGSMALFALGLAGLSFAVVRRKRALNG